MASTEDQVSCSHCNKEVAKPNLHMHEAHCQRFLCLCPVCNESVPKEQLENHREEQHTVVRCQRCNMKMERYRLPDHEADECRERLQACEFCTLELPLSSLKEHTVTCGSRTERCPDCQQYVTLKDRTDHGQICSSTLSEDDSSDNGEPVYEDMNYTQEDNLQADQKFGGSFSHGLGDLYVDPSLDQESEEPPGSSFSFQAQQKKKNGRAVGNGDQIGTCPYCHLALPLQTLQWHENKCKIFESLSRDQQ